ESRPRMFHQRGRNEQPSVEVSQEKLGPDLGAVKAENAKVLRTDLLHAGMKDPARLAQRRNGSAAGRAMTGTSADHRKSLQEKQLGSSHCRGWDSGDRFLP